MTRCSQCVCVWLVVSWVRSVVGWLICSSGMFWNLYTDPQLAGGEKWTDMNWQNGQVSKAFATVRCKHDTSCKSLRETFNELLSFRVCVQPGFTQDMENAWFILLPTCSNMLQRFIGILCEFLHLRRVLRPPATNVWLPSQNAWTQKLGRKCSLSQHVRACHCSGHYWLAMLTRSSYSLTGLNVQHRSTSFNSHARGETAAYEGKGTLRKGSKPICQNMSEIVRKIQKVQLRLILSSFAF